MKLLYRARYVMVECLLGTAKAQALISSTVRNNCVCLHLCVCALLWVSMCVWRAEVSLRYHSTGVVHLVS